MQLAGVTTAGVVPQPWLLLMGDRTRCNSKVVHFIAATGIFAHACLSILLNREPKEFRSPKYNMNLSFEKIANVGAWIVSKSKSATAVSCGSKMRERSTATADWEDEKSHHHHGGDSDSTNNEDS